MTHASVFSGIGGPEVAASMLGWENLFHCEINPFGRAVLDYWYPNAESYEDITKTDFSEWRGKVNVLTGGFPCQPFSFAGKRRGAEDDRYLWPHMHRCINQVRPDWVVCENVGGILSMVEQGRVLEVASETALFGAEDTVHRYEQRSTFTIERICRDIEADGYSVQPVLIPACAVGAPHRRDRVFIVGHRIAADTSGDGQPASQRQGGRARQEMDGKRQGFTFDGNFRPCDTRPSPDPAQPGSEDMRCGWKDALHATRPAAHADGDRGCEMVEHMEPELADGTVALGDGREQDAADTDRTRLERRDQSGSEEGWQRLHLLRHFARHGDERSQEAGCGRWANFPSVSPVYGGDYGFPFDVDHLTIPFPRWRNESIKAYGNAIVPQVMYEIFRAIEQVENYLKPQNK